ncbi:MAG: carboxypeptidase-like regulatory domain-containing protein [Pyrinomonadaceae bacterium]
MKIVAFTLFLLASSPFVWGCSYLSNPDPPIEYIVGRTESIYLGRLIQHKFRNKKEDGYKYKVHNLIFATEKALKGAVKERFEVEIWERLNKLDSCYDRPVIPRIGERWVFHQNYKEPNPVRYLRGSSDLFWRFDEADERLEHTISAIASITSNSRSTFFGQIDSGDFGFPKDVEGIQVELRDTSGEPITQKAVFTKTRSWIDGLFFKFEDLVPGKYTLRISAPKPLLFDGVYLGVPDIRMKRSDLDGRFYADFNIEIEAKRPEFHCFAVRQ